MKVCALTAVVTMCVVASGCRQDPNVEIWKAMMQSEFIALEDDYFALEHDYAQALKKLEALREEQGQSHPDLNDLGAAELDSAVQTVSYEEPVDTRVTHIVVNPFLTSGHDFDHKPGDDGVSVIIEPRNADDQFVPVAGAVSLVILDPALDGDDARVARWDIDAEESAARMRKSALRGRGINLKLPWQNKPPKHSKLHVFVRYETEDGRRLEDDTELFVVLPGQVSSRWTPKSSVAVVRPELPAATEPATFRQSASTPIEPNQESGSESSGAGMNNVEQEQSAPPKQSRRPEWSPYR